LNKINYTRSERNAIIVLLCIILSLIILKQPIVKMMTSNANQIKEDSVKYFALQQQIEDARTTYYNSNNNYKYNKIRSKEERNFKIEINSATKEEFEKLYGIGNVFAERIIKYRTKIGGFSTIEQIKEVYGIHDTVFQKFKHNLSIIPVKNNGTTVATSKQKKIEINAATMEDLLQLKGIGNVYAKRIFEFREKLGGFYALEQLKDVYGIHDSIYQKFINQIYIQPKSIQKININTATLEELMSNPYFFPTLAKQIIGYRTKVKPFQNVEDLKKIYYIRDNPSYYNKILPYVEL
jgi:competence protein ComEA